MKGELSLGIAYSIYCYYNLLLLSLLLQLQSPSPLQLLLSNQNIDNEMTETLDKSTEAMAYADASTDAVGLLGSSFLEAHSFHLHGPTWPPSIRPKEFFFVLILVHKLLQFFFFFLI